MKMIINHDIFNHKIDIRLSFFMLTRPHILNVREHCMKYEVNNNRVKT